MRLQWITTSAALALICTPANAADDLKARIQYGGDVFVITNNGSSEISDCYLTVNSQFKRTGLRFAPGQPVTVNVGSLISRSGTRLNLAVDGIQRVHLQCYSPRDADISMTP